MGLYFIVFRPPLLPEDLLYMGSTMQYVKNNIPGLLNWLQNVFWVMGGYILATGVLTIFISFTSFRTRLPGGFYVVALAGTISIGLMTAVNFIIESDFKWVLLALTLLWSFALILYRLHK
jgi:hypothetical protein